MCFRMMLLVMLMLLLASHTLAGDLDSPAPPEDPLSAMYTLEDLYQRLENGTPGEKRTGGFREPEAGPSVGTGHTVDEIMDKAPVPDNTDGAVPADVTSGRTYWGLRTDGTWGLQVGTSTACPPAPTGDATVDDVRWGKTFSNQTGVGLVGEGLCPTVCEGDATEDDVRFGKTFSNATEVGLTGKRYGGCVCEGTLSPGGRWCDNGDGTVTDMTTCLVWLKNAGWGGTKAWRNSDNSVNRYDDAHARAGILQAGAIGAGLNDGSVVGDWRLPTKSELEHVRHGTEAVGKDDMQFFTGIAVYYWSSTTSDSYNDEAFYVDMEFIGVTTAPKSMDIFYVWPVRGNQ